MVPTHFARLLALPEEVRARYDVSSVKLVGHTGSACPIDVKRQMIEWWGPVFFDAYGATEVGTTCMITSEEWLEHPGSVGRAIPPFTAIVVDDDGNEVPRGTEGRHLLRGRHRPGHRLPERPREDRRRPPPPRRLHPGRDRLRRRRRLRVHHRPLQRHDRLGRGEHLPGRGRAGPHRAPRRGRRRRHRRAPPRHGRGGQGARRARGPRGPARRRPTSSPSAASGWPRYKCPRSVDIVDTVGRTTMGKVNKRALRAPFWDSARTIGG